MLICNVALLLGAVSRPHDIESNHSNVEWNSHPFLGDQIMKKLLALACLATIISVPGCAEPKKTDKSATAPAAGTSAPANNPAPAAGEKK
jgi:hypothetical protein